MSVFVKDRQSQKTKPKKKFKCLRCGGCCREYGATLTITSRDIARWQKEGREDILRYVWCIEFEGIVPYRDTWFNSETGEGLGHCPFLQKIGQERYQCAIHETKPEICKQFWCVYTRKGSEGG